MQLSLTSNPGVRVQRRVRFVRGISFGAVVVLAAACGGDDPIVPSVSAPTGGIASAGAVGSAVGSIPSIKITDSKGRAAKDVMVRWRVTAGGGDVVNDSVRTSPSGEATSGGWTLGTVAGTQTLQASADGVPAVTFTAEAAPGAPARMAVTSGIAQRAVVGTVLPNAATVRVEDLYGNAVPGVPVVFSVLQGGGSVTGGQQTTNAQGVAAVGSWRLGTTSGDQVLRVISGTLADLNISATADAGALANFTATSGTSFDGATRAPTPRTPTVRTTDEFGNALGGVEVTFTPSAASGGVSSTRVLSDPTTGLASVTWTLGTAPTQSMTASVAGLPGKVQTFTSTAFASDFDIEVRFIGTGGTVVQREAFAKSVIRWRRVLSQDLHNTRIVTPAGACAGWIPAMNETVNDLVIYARLTPIDGPGKVLGQAGPCLVNTSTWLTAVGVMEFDIDDLATLLANNTLDPVVLHEVGHVLGIGTLWTIEEASRALLVDRGSADPYFIGASAVAAFRGNGGLSYSGAPVPVENSGGTGTRDSHWRRTIFGRELMQGFANAGGSPMSATTVSSLIDLGYPGVQVSAADAFTFGLSAFFASPAAMVELSNDVADIPLIGVGRDGSTRVIRPKGAR